MANQIDYRAPMNRRNGRRPDVGPSRLLTGGLFGRRPQVEDDQIAEFFTESIAERVQALRDAISDC